jgi:predicted glycosyltransferase
MALEAAVLGTPTVRLSDFGLEVSAFKAIQKYGLIFNFLPSQIDQAIIKIDDLLTQDKQGLIKERSRNLIKDMEDPLPYFSNAILRHLSLDRDCHGN